MALIKCAECGAQVSDKAAACVRCGAPIAATPSAPAAALGGKRQYGWGSVLVASLVVVACIGSQSNSGSGTGAGTAPRAFGELDALALCQTTLKRVSKDPEKAEVPYVRNQGSGNEAYFAWGASTKMARMRNGLGMEVAASASCMVDMSAKKITRLTLNGETLI